MMVLPWWVSCYLFLVVVFFLIEIVTLIPEDRASAFGSFMSLVCIVAFVLSYFNPFIAARFGIMFFPMVVIGIAWEFVQSIKNTKLAQEELLEEKDLSENEKSFLINMATAMNAILVVPGYVLGMKICYDILISWG